MCATVRICRCVAAYVPAVSACVCVLMGVSVCAPIRVWVCLCVSLLAFRCSKNANVYGHMGLCTLLYVCMCLYLYVCIFVCVWVNERCQVLLHAVPAASGAICVGLGGRGADDFNVLEPQTDLSQTVVSMKPRQLGPIKLNRLIWVVNRRQTLWLHCNPRSDSLGNLWQAETHKQWNVFVSIIKC